MKLQVTKGIAIGKRVEKGIPTLQGLMRSTFQMESKDRAAEDDLNMTMQESNDKLNEHLKSQYKDQKWLRLAFDHELKPLKLKGYSGGFLVGQRLDSVQDGYVHGPINSKGKRLKVIDLTDARNIPKNIPKVKLRKEPLMSDL